MVKEQLTLFGLTGTIRGNDGYYFYNLKEISNNTWFHKAKIDKEYQSNKILGYYYKTNGFPYCKTKEDAYKLAMSLVENKKISLW